MTTIYLIEDDEALRFAIGRLLRAEGYQVRAFSGPREFLQHSPRGEGNCLVTDARLEDMDGVCLVELLAQRGCRIPSILISGWMDEALERRASKAGVVGLLSKPLVIEVFLGAIEAALAPGSGLPASGWRAHARPSQHQAAL